VTAASAEGAPPGAVGHQHRALARRIRWRLDDYLRFAIARVSQSGPLRDTGPSGGGGSQVCSQPAVAGGRLRWPGRAVA
jgi:hypothetical protein